MSAAAVRQELVRLSAERLEARESGLGDNVAYMADLESEVLYAREAYVGLAVTEIATLRAELGGALQG
jgi:hypothetical protein